MSFFFNKSESDENLQYDDTAFLHFATATCTITSILFICLIYRDLSNRKDPQLKKIKNNTFFQPRIKQAQKRKKSYFSSSAFLYKFIVILACVTFGVFCYCSISEQSKMIGFDPYEIMGVEIGAPLNVIKKAYRKLALEFHPDRNQGNHEAAAKFVQITKAYKCFTEEQAMQNYKKYGNPDGQVSSKVGIGLPRFMVQVQNQYFILFPIFMILLYVIPRGFLRWSSKIKPMDDNKILIVDYVPLHTYFRPGMNMLSFTLMLGSMKEMDKIFKGKQQLTPDIENGFKEILINSKTVSAEEYQKIPKYVIYRSCAVYSYLTGKSKKEGLSSLFPELTKKIILFSLFYAQKSNHGKLLLNNSNFPVNYFGTFPFRMSLFCSRQLYNPTVNLADVRSIQFLDMTVEEQLMCKNIPIGGLQYNLLWDDEKINTLVGNFEQSRRKYIREQLECLPALKLQIKLFLGDEETKQMTIEDFAEFQVTVVRKKETPGFVVTRDHNVLTKQQWFLIVTYNQNMMFFTPVQFQSGQLKVSYRFPHRQSVVQPMKFEFALASANYPNLDVEAVFQFNVLPRIQNRQVIIHKDDQNIDKIPKDFFESLASMEAMNVEDKELSEGSDTEQQQRQKNAGFPGQEVEQEQQGHGHGHHCSEC